MYKESEFKKEVYKTKDIMKILDICYGSINYYDKTGKLPIKRNEKGRRVIFREDLLNYLDSLGMLLRDKDNERRDVLYCRVSSNEQKQKGDLDRQVLYLIENISDLKNPLILKEVGSGLNDKRQKLQELIKLVQEDKINRIFITYRDRLTRFGFNYLESVFRFHNTDIIVLKDKEDKSIQDELVEDIISILTSFSGKLYGLKSKKMKKVLKEKLSDEL